MGTRDGDSSPDLVGLGLESYTFGFDWRHAGLGLRTRSGFCKLRAEDPIQVHLTSNVKTLESETAIGLPLTWHGYITDRYVTLTNY